MERMLLVEFSTSGDFMKPMRKIAPISRSSCQAFVQSKIQPLCQLSSSKRI